MLDQCANCIAVISVRERANYMGFKYFSGFPIKLLADPCMTPEEQRDTRAELEKLVLRLPSKDQEAARKLIKENVAKAYWFQPEYNSPKDLLKLSPADMHVLYKVFSGPAHGSFSGQLLFTDYPAVREIKPRQHPYWSKKAVEASSRLLLEIARLLDEWECLGHEAEYQPLMVRVTGIM